MQIVIEMPDRIYRTIQKRHLNIIDKGIVEDAIRNGIPLPKGHGRIVDGDIILIWLINKGVIDKLKCGEIASVYKEATIIEAGNEERTNEE